MEDSDISFDDFSVEMEDFSVTKVDRFDRVWKWGEGGSIHQQPLILDGVVYFGSCNHNVYAVSLLTGKEIWRFRTSGVMINTSPVEHMGMLFIGSYDQNLYALDKDSGRLVWKFPTSGKIISLPFASNGRVYVGSEDHNVYALDARDGRLIWKFRTMDEVTSTPTESGGRVYFGSFDQNFYCVDARDGALIWKFPTQGEVHIMNPVLVEGGTVYFGSFDNNLYALDSETGVEKWRLKVGQYGNYMSPVLHEGKLYLSNRENALLSVSLDGRILWRFLRSELVCIPLIYKGSIYVGCEDHNMYCLGLDGVMKWKYATQGVTQIRPAASGNRLVFSSWDCNLYCLDIMARRLIWKFRTEGSPGYRPPPHECFTLTLKVRGGGEETKEGRKKAYDLNMQEEEGGGAFYKSRITYQTSTRYREKGKYQAEEEF